MACDIWRHFHIGRRRSGERKESASALWLVAKMLVLERFELETEQRVTVTNEYRRFFQLDMSEATLVNLEVLVGEGDRELAAVFPAIEINLRVDSINQTDCRLTSTGGVCGWCSVV